MPALRQKGVNDLFVCVLNKDGQPINPCHPARARKLIQQKKASRIRRFPMVIQLTHQADVTQNQYDYDVRIDPGSKTTGVAIVKNEKEVVALGEIHHKKGISESLKSRSDVRRGRRNRKTRYRHCKWKNAIPLATRYNALTPAKRKERGLKKPSFGRESKEGWLAPSLLARVNQTTNWVKKMQRFIPITSIGMELVKFDFQKMEDEAIAGVEYQQGTLLGYNVREYLLEKWGRKCSYCEVIDVALEVEHIDPSSRGGSNRISNLCLACRECNEEKDNMYLSEWLEVIQEKKNKRHVTIQKNIPLVLKQCKQPLRDASAVNSTRWKLYTELKQLGLPFRSQSGAQTKMQRIIANLPKEHYYDALCISETVENHQFKTTVVHEFHAMGRGNRQMVRVDKFGFPLLHLEIEKYDKSGKRKGHKERKKQCHGFQTGDMVKAVVTKGKKIGSYVGRVAIRHNGYFNIATKMETVQGISYRDCIVLQKDDGWKYAQKQRSY